MILSEFKIKELVEWLYNMTCLMSSILSQSFASPHDASVPLQRYIHSFICRKETDCQSRVRERSSVTHSHSWPCRCRNATGGAERECDGNITSRTSDQRLDHLNPFESITIWGWRGTSIERSREYSSATEMLSHHESSIVPSDSGIEGSDHGGLRGPHSQLATQCNSYHANIRQIDAKYTSI